ncbi:PROBABLE TRANSMEMBRANE PROTEIN [hydrothermal vent metagenome]|uniref:PROBABLE TRANSMEMBRANE PROTEIN n=1 Tax=hydrothermal vent metagenome TaxID=652676 RepID=A0A3B1DWI6_9ZZZZ
MLTTAQSLSFIHPVGKIFEYTINLFDSSYLIFGVFSVFGVLIGAFMSSKINFKKPKPKLKLKTTTKSVTLIDKLFGGVCLGFGGILVIGCTVGQGLSGLSTLSLASAIAIICIYISAYLTGLSMHKNNYLSTSFAPPE